MTKVTAKTIKLVRKAINGDDYSFEKLLKLEYEYIYRIAFSYVFSEQDALDIIQESTLEAFLGVKKLENPQFFYTWYIKILMRKAANFLEKRNLNRKIEQELRETVFIESKLKIENKLDLVNSFETLELKYREVLQFYYYKGFSIQEISLILELPIGTVKTNLFRGKKRLKDILGGNEYEI